ncbi:FeoA family protein [Peribacillus sp. B-H-3]|uniref:FeoA family protein n=1 Tax=Peribacillus sp. B-H-3 TaxID=3400420 RepID=UPI003B025353
MLTGLKAGEKAVVFSMVKTNQLVRRRLLDLGICEGSEVCLRCIMPFGGPYMIECNGQSVAIRRRDANEIEVERELA